MHQSGRSGGTPWHYLIVWKRLCIIFNPSTPPLLSFSSTQLWTTCAFKACLLCYGFIIAPRCPKALSSLLCQTVTFSSGMSLLLCFLVLNWENRWRGSFTPVQGYPLPSELRCWKLICLTPLSSLSALAPFCQAAWTPKPSAPWLNGSLTFFAAIFSTFQIIWSLLLFSKGTGLFQITLDRSIKLPCLDTWVTAESLFDAPWLTPLTW